MSSLPWSFIILCCGTVAVQLVNGLNLMGLAPLPPSPDCIKMRDILHNILHSTDKCIILSIDNVDVPCAMGTEKTLIITVSLEQMFNGYVFKLQARMFCDKVLALLTDWTLFRNFMAGRSFYKQFHPFTRIAFFNHYNDTGYLGSFDVVHWREIYVNALYVYWGRLTATNHSQIVDVLTAEVITFQDSTYLENTIKGNRNMMLHPLFDSTVQKNEINISLFDCPPFVIRLDQNNTMDSFDGAEFRFLKDITKDWKINVVARDNTSGDPWSRVALDVETGITNIATCSMWLSAKSFERFDLSNTFNHLCITFLVPKPTIATQASYIYLPLEKYVWALLVTCLFATAIIYFILVYFNYQLEPREERTISGALQCLGKSFLDTICIVTSHGLPEVIQRIPIQILIISWTMLSLLIGTAYSAKYTSVLTSPRFTKPVNTIHDFLEQDLMWGEVGVRSDIRHSFTATENPAYIEVADRLIVEQNLTERLNLLATGKYAKFVKVLGTTYVTDTDTLANYASSLRLMKDCLFNYFTVFPFDKYSPYTNYVNRKLAQYTDAGIIEHWFTMMNVKYGQSYISSFFDNNPHSRLMSGGEPQSLRVENLTGAFYLLGVGLLVSIVAFGFEKYYWDHEQQMKKLQQDEFVGIE